MAMTTITKQQAATHLGVSLRSVTAMITTGALHKAGTRTGKTMVYLHEVVEIRRQKDGKDTRSIEDQLRFLNGAVSLLLKQYDVDPGIKITKDTVGMFQARTSRVDGNSIDIFASMGEQTLLSLRELGRQELWYRAYEVLSKFVFVVREKNLRANEWEVLHAAEGARERMRKASLAFGLEEGGWEYTEEAIIQRLC